MKFLRDSDKLFKNSVTQHTKYFLACTATKYSLEFDVDGIYTWHINFCKVS